MTPTTYFLLFAPHLLLQKCGTTSLAAYLKLHPDLTGIAGTPGHGAARKHARATHPWRCRLHAAASRACPCMHSTRRHTHQPTCSSALELASRCTLQRPCPRSPTSWGACWARATPPAPRCTAPSSPRSSRGARTGARAHSARRHVLTAVPRSVLRGSTGTPKTPPLRPIQVPPTFHHPPAPPHPFPPAGGGRKWRAARGAGNALTRRRPTRACRTSLRAWQHSRPTRKSCSWWGGGGGWGCVHRSMCLVLKALRRVLLLVCTRRLVAVVPAWKRSWAPGNPPPPAHTFGCTPLAGA